MTSHNKQAPPLSTKTKVMKLKELIQDAVSLKYNPKLIKNFKKQLKEQEEILKKDREKRKNQGENK